jgi:hypothetical protein
MSKVDVECKVCHKIVSVYPNKIKRNKIGVFCSHVCYDYYKKNIWNKKILKCPTCEEDFKIKLGIYNSTRRRKPGHIFYCCKQCHSKSMITSSSDIVSFICDNCGKSFDKMKKLRLQPLKFCNKSCRAKYFARVNNLGGQRSLMEQKLELYIREFFPSVILNINDRDILGGLELDLYLPELRFAIEVNGPCHFIPIWGEDTLKHTRRNDIIKSNYCQKKGIRLLYITDILDRKHDNTEQIFKTQIKPIIIDMIDECIIGKIS